MTTSTTVANKQATNYQEAYDLFVAWHPKTLKRKGANGMTFDYLPVQNYEHFLDETVGPANWENDVSADSKGVVVRLKVFGVMKASSSDIQTGSKTQNEVNKAEARAFRRAAAKHGLLRYLWEKDNDTEDEDEDDDERPARKSSFSKSSSKSSGSGSGSGKASAGQIKYLNDAFGVPKGVAAKLTGGRDGSASALIDALRDVKDEDGYEDDPIPYIKKALKKIAPKLVSALDEGDEDEEDEDED